MTTHSLFPVMYEVARLLMAAVFLFSGADKLLHWRAFIAELAQLGLQWPLCGGLTIFTQLMGGAMLMTGLGAWVGASFLACFTFAATVLAHPFWLHCGTNARREFTTALEHLAIVGGLVLIAAVDLSQ